jgi:hypothetical protein
MRLYEFTDPTDCSSCAGDADDSIRHVERNGKPDDAATHPTTKAPTRRVKPLDAGSLSNHVSGTHGHVHRLAR